MPLAYDCLVFDLDGTISDPKDGMCRSLNYALQKCGYPERGEDELQSLIGPPLDKSFAALTGSNDKALIAALVAKYRERYATTGYAENVLYDGMADTLAHLFQQVKLGVCTSKRVDFAEKILDMFGLRSFYSFVDGGDVGIAKAQQLRRLKDTGTITDRAVMLGDRDVDLTAAHDNGLHAAGVLWGYGGRDELMSERPQFLFAKPRDLMADWRVHACP